MKNLLPAFLYYGLVKPFSLLPLGLLYLISDGLYYIIYRLVGYRKAVVLENLANSFPDKTDAERNKIAGLFYRHLCDLVVESVRGFSISEKEVNARYKIVNPEVCNRFFDDGRSVIYAAGHYNNWEWSTLSAPHYLSHKVLGIYTPLNSPFFEKIFLQSRCRYGMEGVSTRDVRNVYEADAASGRLTGTIFAIDQGSRSAKQLYWMDFLHQDTGVLFGTEKYAREFNLPVVYFRIFKRKRGYYELECELITDNPAAEKHGAITENFTRKLETQIQETPQYWLWSHKRWKRKRTAAES